MQGAVPLWQHPLFWDFIGAICVAYWFVKAIFSFLRYWHRETDRKDVFWVEFYGLVFGSLICAITFGLREWWHPNLAGALMLNGAVAFVLRAMVRIVGTWVVYMEGKLERKRQGVEDDVVPVSRIENNALIPALSGSFWVSAGSAAALANGDVEPAWLEHWAVTAFASIATCTYITKLESTHTLFAIWSQLTKGNNPGPSNP